MDKAVHPLTSPELRLLQNKLQEAIALAIEVKKALPIGFNATRDDLDKGLEFLEIVQRDLYLALLEGEFCDG